MVPECLKFFGGKTFVTVRLYRKHCKCNPRVRLESKVIPQLYCCRDQRVRDEGARQLPEIKLVCWFTPRIRVCAYQMINNQRLVLGHCCFKSESNFSPFISCYKRNHVHWAGL